MKKIKGAAVATAILAAVAICAACSSAGGNNAIDASLAQEGDRCKENDPVPFDISDMMGYIAECVDGALTKEDILDFDPNIRYIGPMSTGILAGNDEYIFMVSENRSFNGIDGAVIYSGGSNSDKSLGLFVFAAPNITFEQYRETIANLEEFAQQAIDIAYYDEQYFEQKRKEIPEWDNHFPYFGLLAEIDEISDILSIYGIEDEKAPVNNRCLEIRSNAVLLPLNGQDWQDSYSLSVHWVGEDIFVQLYREILPWHINGEQICNELYIILNYPLA